MQRNLITIGGTGTILKATSLTNYMRERHGDVKHDSHLITDLNHQLHAAPELQGSFEGNVAEKYHEMAWTLVKIANGDPAALDSYLPYQLAFNKAEVTAGNTQVLFWAEDSGVVFPQINGNIRHLIINFPELFGDMAEMVKGLITDPQIYKTFDTGFPGVETAPVIASLGRGGFIKFIKRCGELLGCDVNPLEKGDVENALRIVQQSYLTYFLWEPGMRIEHKNLAAIAYKNVHMVTESIFTGRNVDRLDVELDDCQIAKEKAEAGDFRTNGEQENNYLKGPNCRWHAFDQMMTDILSRPMVKKHEIVRKSDITQRSYDVALISHGGETTIKNRLAAQLPGGYTVKSLVSSDIVKAKTDHQLYENIFGIDQLLNNSDCFVFEPHPKNLSPLELSALSLVNAEIITYILTAPAHRNKRIYYLNENGCLDEILQTGQSMANRGALGDYIQYRDQPRIGTILTTPNTDALSAALRSGADNYFRVDFHNHGNQLEIEVPRFYLPEQNEFVASMLCSAALRGSFYNLSKATAGEYLKAGYTINWGLGDKVSMMGAVYQAVFERKRDGLDYKVTGSSNWDILTGETMSGKGVPGVDGRIYNSLTARTSDVIEADILNFSDGGEGSLVELDFSAMRKLLGFADSPIIVSTLDLQSPIRLAAERRLGKGSESVVYLSGTIDEQVKALGKLIAPEGHLRSMMERK